jgi:sugar phosphate isomerase/epimerase
VSAQFRSAIVFVAASTGCFADLSLDDALDRLADLEYTRVEVAIREHGAQLKPSYVAAHLEEAIAVCRQLRRMTPVAYGVEIAADGDAYYEQFHACCRLAKATKVVCLCVQAGEIGTPFNAEVERLRELVRVASLEGVLVGVKTEAGRMTQDPDTTLVLCNNVKGLGITLDPSHYVCGPCGGGNYQQLMKFVCHVQLRDTTKDRLQVRIGQGEIEYGRLLAQLEKVRYDRALTVDIVNQPEPDFDHSGELRKLRLLLESLLV